MRTMEGELSREVEFDWSEDGGRMVSTGRVRSVIMYHLTRRECEQAAQLIVASAPEIADALLAQDVQTSSIAVREALAEAFIIARDFARAGRAALMIGDPGRAAPYFEQGGQLAEAAELYERAGKLMRAAELRERSLDYDRAAALYGKAGKQDRAAAVLERAGNNYAAGRIWARMHHLDRAVRVLQRVEDGDVHHIAAMTLLGHILTAAGHKEAAAAKYIEIIKSRKLSEETADAYERLAHLYLEMNEKDAAVKLLRALVAFDPTRVDAAGLLAQIDRGPVPTPSKAPPPNSASLLPMPNLDPATTGLFTALHRDVDVLRQLPLFAELSLDELRALHAIGERTVFAPGATLIEEGHEGADLFVILDGAVVVTLVDDDGRTHPLVDLGYGASLGEMALVDRGPTSARVVARTQTTTFRWPLEALRSHLATNAQTELRLLKVISRTLSVRLRETNRKVNG